MAEPKMNLDLLYCPRTVALIGASRTPGKVGHEILANLIKGGFEGEIIPVNPMAVQLLDLRSYKEVLDYGGTIDLSVIAVPVSQVMHAVGLFRLSSESRRLSRIDAASNSDLERGQKVLTWKDPALGLAPALTDTIGISIRILN
jgi:hypothetical protein